MRLRTVQREFSRGSVLRTPSFHLGHGFHPWSRNQIPQSHVPLGMTKKKKRERELCKKKNKVTPNCFAKQAENQQCFLFILYLQYGTCLLMCLLCSLFTCLFLSLILNLLRVVIFYFCLFLYGTACHIHSLHHNIYTVKIC